MDLKDILSLVNAGFTKSEILYAAQLTTAPAPAQPVQTPVQPAQPMQPPVQTAQPMQTPVQPAQPMQTPVQQAAQMQPSQQLDMTTLMQSLYQGTAQMDLPPAQHRTGQDILADRYADLMRASSASETESNTSVTRRIPYETIK